MHRRAPIHREEAVHGVVCLFVWAGGAGAASRWSTLDDVPGGVRVEGDASIGMSGMPCRVQVAVHTSVLLGHESMGWARAERQGVFGFKSKRLQRRMSATRSTLIQGRASVVPTGSIVLQCSAARRDGMGQCFGLGRDSERLGTPNHCLARRDPRRKVPCAR